MEHKTDQKGEIFYNILKNAGYENIKNFTPKSFDYLFNIPETKEFFDWFVANVDESWCVKKEDLEEFKIREAKGQIIWDLETLESMNNLSKLKSEYNKEIKKNPKTTIAGFSFDDLYSDDEEDLPDDPDELDNEIEMLEKEMKMLNEHLNFRRNHRKKLTNLLNNTKQEHSKLELDKTKLEMKTNYMKNTLKNINQKINKSLAEFQSKVDDEEKFSQKINTDLNELEKNQLDYIAKEKQILMQVKENLYTRYYYDEIEKRFKLTENPFKKVDQSDLLENKEKTIKLENTQLGDEFVDYLNPTQIKNLKNRSAQSVNAENNNSDLDLNLKEDYEELLNIDFSNDHQNIETMLKLMSESYPKLKEDWFKSKLDYEFAKCSANEMKRIIENKNEFFEFTQEQLQTNPYARQHIQEKINQNDKKAQQMAQMCETLGEEITQSISKLANAKMAHIADTNLNKTLVELGLYQNKQEELYKILSSQDSRLSEIDNAYQSKLKEIESLKTLFEDLIENKSIFMPNNETKSSMGSSLTSLASNATINNKNMNNSLYSSSKLSISMANLLTSTANNSYLPTNTNSTLILTSPTKQNFLHSFSHNNKINKHLSSSTLSISRIASNDPCIDLKLTVNKRNNNQDFISQNDDSPAMHIINQFLILVLTRLESDESIQEYVKLKKPVSINFNDNLENFQSLYENVNEIYTKNRTIKIRKNLKSLYKTIEKGMDYLYDKEPTRPVSSMSLTKSSSTINLKYDLSKIQIQMPKFICEPLEQLEKKREEIENKFYVNILKKINVYKTHLSSNKLEQLKRNLFVQFYLNPHLMENVVIHLDSNIHDLI